MGKVGREGSVDVGAEGVEIDLNDLVVRSTLVGAKVLLKRIGRRCDARTLGRLRRVCSRSRTREQRLRQGSERRGREGLTKQTIKRRNKRHKVLCFVLCACYTTRYRRKTPAKHDTHTHTHLEVVLHARVVRESRARCANLSTHVTDSPHSRARDGVNAGAEVLQDSARSSLYSQNSGHL